MQCERSNIKSIKNSRILKVEQIARQNLQGEESPLCILSNRNLADYRLILGKANYSDDGDLIISAADAEMLGVDEGSEIRLLPIR